LDSSFLPLLEQPAANEYYGTYARVTDLAILTDGRVVVGRAAYPSAGFGDWHTEVRIFTREGSESHTFNLAGILRLTSDKSDRLVVGGRTVYVLGAGTVSTAVVQRYSTDGNFDPSFLPPSELARGSGGYQVGVTSLTIAANGDILLAGEFFMNPANRFSPETCALRLNPDGALKWRFGEQPFHDDADFVGEDEFGEIVIGRSHQHVVDRLTADGKPVGTFLLPLFDDTAVMPEMLLEPGGRLILPGRFSQVAGISNAGLVALSRNGVPDLDFDPGTGFGAGNDRLTINAMARQADGRLLLGGSFSVFDGTSQPWLVRLFPKNPSVQPTLGFRRTDSLLEISWSATAAGFALESAATLETAANWQPSSASITQENGLLKATLPVNDSARFFRLRK
jgi:hypothetical protein